VLERLIGKLVYSGGGNGGGEQGKADEKAQ
jgi:hypothetical protein